MPDFEYDRELAELQRSRQREAIRDYYTVTPKGWKLMNLLSARMDELDRERQRDRHDSDGTSTPEWTEYLRVFHTNIMLIRASSSYGVFINPTYQAEEEEALEDLLEGGYIVRSSE